MKVYYAHPVSLYNTPQEKRDIALLESLGFEVENPNTEKHQVGYDIAKAKSSNGSGMEHFFKVVLACDAIAFRAFPDGKIGSGVMMEVDWALEGKLPVIELPNIVESRKLSRTETKQYLQLLGAR